MRAARLREVASINPRGERLRADDLVSFVGMSELNAETARATPLRTRTYGEVSKGYTVFRNGDILAAKITPCWENGKVGQATLDHPVGVGSTEFHVVRPTDALDHRYLMHFLRQARVRAAGELRMTGSGGQRRVPASFLDDLEISLPSLVEQQRIAAILDHADALRAKRRQVLAHLDAATVAMFSELRPLAGSSGAQLREVAHIWDCPHSTPKWTESGVICLRTPNLTRGGWDWRDTRFVDPAQFVARSKGGGAQPGDIILSREGTVGIAAIVQPEMKVCMGQRLVQVRPDPRRLVPEWALAYLLTALDPARISLTLVGSTAKHLNVKDLRELVVPLPPMAIQVSFAERSTALSIHRARVTRLLAHDDELFASLQSRAFRGEL